ncbi:MAG: mechanosensitive ion channel family protein [Proteobacteria bacterium]|nr:mechanosensitive ion channel family protein [Pseudomonadota bacterium]
MNPAIFSIPELHPHLTRYVIPFFYKIIGAVVLWILAGFLIKTSKRLLIRALERKNVDPTLIIYAKHTLGLGLRLLALLLIFGIFGIETTSFSAAMAAAGVAIGVAWSGLLSNFAAGIFLIIFRPFKLGDSISAGGVNGVVREIGLFATLIDNGDNLRYFVGNNKLFSDNILNYSKNPYRIAQFRIQLAHAVEPEQAIQRFIAELGSIEGLSHDQAVSGEIVEFNPMGTLITVKVACHQSAHARIVAEGNRRIASVLRKESFPIPESRTLVLSSAGRGEP